MPFKIVKTIESGKVMITAVPQEWEDSGQLFWPQTVAPIDRLRSNENSRPDTGWITLNCEVKKTGIASFREALKLEEFYANVSSSDEECFRMPSGRQRKPPVVRSDFNALLQSIPKEDVPQNQVCEDEGKDVSGPKSNEALNEAENVSGNFEEQNVEVTGENLQDVMNQPQDRYLEILTTNSSMDIEQQLTNLQLGVDSAQQNSVKVLKICRENSVKLDKILQMLATGSISEKHVSLDELEGFPLKTSVELEEFEKELQDVTFRAKFLQAMKNIGGVSGKKDGIRIAYKLIDHIFDRQLLQRYSWTGFSKSDPKKSFRDCKNFLECFLDIIKAADARFSEVDCEDFFKNKVLKHSNARAKLKQELD